LRASKCLVVKSGMIKGIWASLVTRLAKPGLKKARKASQFSKR